MRLAGAAADDGCVPILQADDPARKLRSRLRWFAAGAVVVALLLCVARYRCFTIQYCAICASERRTDEWGFGLGTGLRLPFASSDDVRESATFRDPCDADHRHDWRTDHTWDSGLLSGCLACNGWRRGAFAGVYESEPRLREVVRHEIETGALDRATALRLVAVPWCGWCADRAAPGTLPDAALLAMAERLLTAHFAPRGAQAPAYIATYLRWMGGSRPAR